jgi:hypothetical protein
MGEVAGSKILETEMEISDKHNFPLTDPAKLGEPTWRLKQGLHWPEAWVVWC